MCTYTNSDISSVCTILFTKAVKCYLHFLYQQIYIKNSQITVISQLVACKTTSLHTGYLPLTYGLNTSDTVMVIM
jgi:hypothetical protein